MCQATLWTDQNIRNFQQVFRQLHTEQCNKVDPDLIKTTKVGNIFIFKFYCTCTSQGIFRFLRITIYIVCTWIYLIGTEIVGSTLGGTDEVRFDPPICHHQSNKNCLTQCFTLWFMTIFKVPFFGYLLNLKHLYYYDLKNILAIHQYFVFWFLNLYGEVQKY